MNRLLYKAEIWVLKFIPYLIALLYFINTICLNLGIIIPWFCGIAHLSPLTLLFLYLSSYTFKFCEYHRIPLHYVVSNNILNLIDYHIGFPISDYNFILMHSLLFGLASVICGILKLRNGKSS